MLRRDYILRMIDEFMRVLMKLTALKEKRLWAEADADVESEVKRLTGTDPLTLAGLSDTELLARLLGTGDTAALRAKSFILARLLLEAADIGESRGSGHPPADLLRLRALNLMLTTALRSEEMDWPEFVPSIDRLADQLQETGLPLGTYGLLMQHFERTGQFARAEDALFAMREIEPASPALQQFGASFYQRLLGKTDAVLVAGNLPRPEVESGLAEFRAATQQT